MHIKLYEPITQAIMIPIIQIQRIENYFPINLVSFILSK
ncbi:uncharacterized protein METZ01_LOCUS144041 [marine metagenome]|uniref:Uncharacterized protein n=1 Tax=marine metagenome TaxID=408172 RepID=A0A381ZQX7_9ZZZZ